MPDIHDPYLNTVKRTLSEEKIRKRKKKIENNKPKPKSFFSKHIILSDYIYLPESLQNLFLISLFILIPYTFGLIIMTLVIDYKSFSEYTEFNFELFMLTWTIGYETIAIILLLIIIKNAILFKTK